MRVTCRSATDHGQRGEAAGVGAQELKGALA